MILFLYFIRKPNRLCVLSSKQRMHTPKSKQGIEFWVLEAQAEPYIRGLEDARKGNFNLKADDIEKVGTYDIWHQPKQNGAN